MPPARVLLIERNPDIATVLSVVLADAGYAVVAAEALLAGRHLLARGPPDAVLLDVSLDDARDLAACEEARSRFPAAPLIVLTTCPDRAFRDACFQAGVDGVFLKPFDFDALLAAVARLVRPAAGAVNAAGGRARPLRREIASKGANDAQAV
jgi:DNA-binding response OmpR family regulator